MSATVLPESDPTGTELLRIVGEVDVASAPSVVDALAAAVDRATGAVVVDLAEVTFLDSSGVRALLTAREQATTAGIELTVRAPQPAVVRVLQVTGVATALGL